jgi:hypothetical protein
MWVESIEKSTPYGISFIITRRDIVFIQKPKDGLVNLML